MLHHSSQTRYSDKLYRQRRRRFLFRIISVVIVTILLVAGLVYGLLFSGYFKITDIQAQVGPTLSPESIIQSTQSYLDKSGPEIWPFRNNIIFFQSGVLESHLLSDFPRLSEVKVKRRGMNSILIEGSERSPLGSWCFVKSIEKCFFFDDQGAIWGQALRSSGTLLISVEDAKTEYMPDLDHIPSQYINFTRSVLAELKKLEIGVRTVQIPDSTLNDVLVVTADGYKILMTLDYPTDDQLAVFEVFYREHIQNKNPVLNSIDLTIPGRVYTK